MIERIVQDLSEVCKIFLGMEIGIVGEKALEKEVIKAVRQVSWRIAMLYNA